MLYWLKKKCSTSLAVFLSALELSIGANKPDLRCSLGRSRLQLRQLLCAAVDAVPPLAAGAWARELMTNDSDLESGAFRSMLLLCLILFIYMYMYTTIYIYICTQYIYIYIQYIHIC